MRPHRPTARSLIRWLPHLWVRLPCGPVEEAPHCLRPGLAVSPRHRHSHLVSTRATTSGLALGSVRPGRSRPLSSGDAATCWPPLTEARLVAHLGSHLRPAVQRHPRRRHPCCSLDLVSHDQFLQVLRLLRWQEAAVLAIWPGLDRQGRLEREEEHSACRGWSSAVPSRPRLATQEWRRHRAQQWCQWLPQG